LEQDTYAGEKRRCDEGQIDGNAAVGLAAESSSQKEKHGGKLARKKK
jgi:hypothetical protein